MCGAVFMFDRFGGIFFLYRLIVFGIWFVRVRLLPRKGRIKSRKKQDIRILDVILFCIA